MATTGTRTGRISKTEKEKILGKTGAATREDIKNAILWIARNTNLVPTAVGPTASGKTWMADQIAHDIGGEMITVLLSQHTPDEVCGFQMPSKDNKTMTPLAPYWFNAAQAVLDQGKSVVILFDELGLGREETRGAVYTFFRDRHIHGHRLQVPHPESQEIIVMAATNPAPFAAPYRTRCAFFHVPADQNYLVNTVARTSWAKLAAGWGTLTKEGGDSAFSEAAPEPPVTVHGASIAALNAIDASFWSMSPEARGLVVSSLVPPDVATRLLSSAETMDPISLVKDPELLYETLDSMTVPEAMTMMASTMSTYGNLTKKEAAEAHAATMDAIYNRLDLIGSYYFDRSQEMRDSLQHLEVETMAKALEARGLAVDDGTNPVHGSLFDRLDKYAEETKDN